MAKPRFTLYKHIKIGGTWRYCRAVIAVNNKVKPHIVVVGGTEETACLFTLTPSKREKNS